MAKIDIKDLINSNNIAEDLDLDVLSTIAEQVQTGYQVDLDSSSEWLQDVKKVEELSTLASKKKNKPLPNSANIKFPLITKACYEFSSRTYPEIVKDGQIVKTKVIGRDFTGEKQLKARKVEDYMNWQLYWENDDWELELDRLLNRLALIGFLCKKTYFDPIRQTIKSELCEPCDLIINANAKSLDDCTRITHIIHLKLNDLIEGARAGIYSQEVVDDLVIKYQKDNLNPDIDVLEQHTQYDLDEDGYAEPYIITTVKDERKVLRIIARFDAKGVKKKDNEIKYINAKQHFTDFHFLVSPKGKFQSVGFGILLLHLNETINTLLNQLVDAGQLANLQGGYIDSRLKEMGSGNSGHEPGEFKKIKNMGSIPLKEGILPIDYKEPSSVLMQLLGLLIDTARDISGTNDMASGNVSPENSKTGATQIMQAEAVKVHNSINKRIYRSLGNEFYKIFCLDGEYLDPKKASKVLNEDISIEDFNEEEVDVIPVADPNLASASKLASDIQVLQAIMTLPGIDPIKVTHRILQKAPVEKPEELLIDPNQEQPPNPETIKIQADIQNMAAQNQLKQDELELKRQEIQAKTYEIQCRCLELKAKAMLEIAQAESIEKGQQIDLYLKQLDLLSQNISTQADNKIRSRDQDLQALQQQYDEMARREQSQIDNQQIDSE